MAQMSCMAQLCIFQQEIYTRMFEHKDMKTYNSFHKYHIKRKFISDTIYMYKAYLCSFFHLGANFIQNETLKHSYHSHVKKNMRKY